MLTLVCCWLDGVGVVVFAVVLWCGCAFLVVASLSPMLKLLLTSLFDRYFLPYKWIHPAHPPPVPLDTDTVQ